MRMGDRIASDGLSIFRTWNSQRCLGEVDATINGKQYIPGIPCSGHGKCVTGETFYAGVCSCDRGYIGSACEKVGVGENVHPSQSETSTQVLFYADLASLLVYVFFFVVIFANRHQPLIFYCSAQYCFNLIAAGVLAFLQLPLLLQPIQTIHCIARPTLGIFAFHLFVGTVFARVYRTTFVMWEKGPQQR